MRRIFALATLAGMAAAALGCAGTQASRPSPDVRERLQTLQAERERLEQAKREQAHRIRELETQLGLARAEVRELRDDRWDTVRIREQEPEPQEAEPDAPEAPGGGWNEPTPSPSEPEASTGSRPVLKLHGRGEDDEGPLPPVPEAPPGLPALSVAPLPDDAEVALSARRAEAQPAAGAGRTGRPSADRAGETDGAVEQYRAALALVRDRELERALSALESFVREHAEHPYADNALYWRGEVLYAQRRYRAALQAFEQLLGTYPEGNKVADALLKMALCHKRMGRLRQARALFERIRREHPDSVAARVASREDNS